MHLQIFAIQKGQHFFESHLNFADNAAYRTNCTNRSANRGMV